MPSFDTDVPALLLRLDPNPFHHGTLGAIRSLGRSGIEVHVVAAAAGGPVDRSRYLYRSHELPAPPVADIPLLEKLSDISERIGRPAVLIPMDDRGAIVAARLAAGSWAAICSPTSRPTCRSGWPTRPNSPGSAGSLTCRTRRPSSPAAPRRRPKRRPTWGCPSSPSGAAPGCCRPPPGCAAPPWYGPPTRPAGSTSGPNARAAHLLLQSQLPGGPDTDWFFHGCFTHGGGCLIGGSGRKERAWPLRTGLTAVGRWLPNPQVERASLRLARHLGYRGILDLDFRRDAHGRYHLLDFNPRPGAQFRLFTDSSGLDVVRALHLDLTGRTVPGRRSTPGRVFRAENYALLSAVTAFAERPRTALPNVTRGCTEVERAWFAADDPMPFLAMTGAWLRRGARKGAYRVRAAAPGSAPHTAGAVTTHRVGTSQQP